VKEEIALEVLESLATRVAAPLRELDGNCLAAAKAPRELSEDMYVLFQFIVTVDDHLRVAMNCRPLLNEDADDVEYQEVLRASLNKKDPRHQNLATKAWFGHATRLDQFPTGKRVPTGHYTKYFLSDELVNCYFDMLAAHYNSPELRLRVVSSHGLVEHGQAGLLRGIAKEGGIDQYDVVLVPLHLEDPQHWCLGVLDVKQRLVFVLDPMQVRVQTAPAIKHSSLSAA
jgi:hypothetical protein